MLGASPVADVPLAAAPNAGASVEVDADHGGTFRRPCGTERAFRREGTGRAFRRPDGCERAFRRLSDAGRVFRRRGDTSRAFRRNPPD